MLCNYVLQVAKTVNGITYVTTYPRACLEDQNATVVTSPGVSYFMIANSMYTLVFLAHDSR